MKNDSLKKCYQEKVEKAHLVSRLKTNFKKFNRNKLENQLKIQEEIISDLKRLERIN